MGMLINSYAFGVSLAPTTTFLTRFTASPPVDEVSLGTGTLVGNATADTANSRLTTDGTGDWCTFAASSVFDLAGDFTLEAHTDQAAAQVGGLLGHVDSHVTNVGRWVIYCNGDGSFDFYADNIRGIPIVGSAGAQFNGTEKHVAICRESNTWRCYVAGVQKQSTAALSGTIGSTSAVLYIGTDPFSTTARDIAAHIGRVKISNSCLYPGGTTFTPPARTDP